MLQLPFEDVLQDWKDQENHADALILLQDNPLLKYAGLWRAGSYSLKKTGSAGSPDWSLPVIDGATGAVSRSVWPRWPQAVG